jgi:hypothetical protein
MKLQSIVSFFTLYLVSGLSAQIKNNQRNQDIEYSNLQPGRKPTMTASPWGQSASGTVGGKMKQKVTTEQQQPQKNMQNKQVRCKHTKINSISNKSKEVIYRINNTNQKAKVTQPTIIKPRQPIQVYKPTVVPVGLGTPPNRPSMGNKMSQNLKTKPNQPVKEGKPNTIPKRKVIGNKNQSNQATVVKRP